ncbi:MAG: hypothetical protein ACRDKW_13140 [Actinomycetota bacterium]
MKIKPVKQTCAAPGCRDVAGFVVVVTAGGDAGIRAARRSCGEHLEEAVFWAEGVVASDARARYALINRWGPWALELREVPA